MSKGMAFAIPFAKFVGKIVESLKISRPTIDVLGAFHLTMVRFALPKNDDIRISFFENGEGQDGISKPVNPNPPPEGATRRLI
jgi:hypothetical protein